MYNGTNIHMRLTWIDTFLPLLSQAYLEKGIFYSEIKFLKSIQSPKYKIGAAGIQRKHTFPKNT